MNNVSALLAVICLSATSVVHAVETSPLQFVTEYLKDFGAIEHIRLAEERELQAPHQSMLATCVQSGNQYRAEIARQMSRMREMSPPASWRVLSARLLELYDRKLALYTEVVKTCTALGAGADSNASSLEVMAAVSRYDAKVDAIDKSLFQTCTDVFNTLLGATVDRHGKRRLSITAAEKLSLLRQIKVEFGAAVDDDQQTYLVNAASVVRDDLRGHVGVDEE